MTYAFQQKPDGSYVFYGQDWHGNDVNIYYEKEDITDRIKTVFIVTASVLTSLGCMKYGFPAQDVEKLLNGIRYMPIG